MGCHCTIIEPQNLFYSCQQYKRTQISTQSSLYFRSILTKFEVSRQIFTSTEYQISLKPVQREPRWYVRTDRRTDMTELIGAFCLLYRVSQEECTRLRDSVPYVKVYRYNPKHLYPKLNGYGDNGQKKVRSSCGSTYCTCSDDALRVYQNAQSAKLNQYFNTAGYSCPM